MSLPEITEHPAPESISLGVIEGDAVSTEAPVSPPSCDEPIVTRKELWSYYLYYNGDHGVGPISIAYTLTFFQYIATVAGYDPVHGPGSSCLDAKRSGRCVLPWGSGTKAVSSIVLIANGASFAVMTVLFATIGSAADYGTLGRWLLLAVTLICWAAQFATVCLTSASRWGLAMAIYMIGFISHGATLVFFSAAFPRLARNTQHSRDLREKYDRGEISSEVYEWEECLEKNRISGISMQGDDVIWQTHVAIGFIVTCSLNLSLQLPLQKNSKVKNHVLILTNVYWILLGIWWFIFQQPRPGPNLPKGESYLTIGWKQIWVALKQYKKVPHTFKFFFAYFLLSDVRIILTIYVGAELRYSGDLDQGLTTTDTLVSICRNDKFSFSFLQMTYLSLSQGIASTASTFGFCYIQRHWKISTKNMFVVTNVVTTLIPLWGMIGIWTNKFGFHNAWEFWAYNIVFGLFQAPNYAFSQAIMAELSPPGFDNVFSGLFGLSNRVSSTIGPNVIQAIINKSGNSWDGFPFLFLLCTSASLIIWFAVDVPKGRRAAVRWAAEQRGTAAGATDTSGEDIGASVPSSRPVTPGGDSLSFRCKCYVLTP